MNIVCVLDLLPEDRQVESCRRVSSDALSLCHLIDGDSSNTPSDIPGVF